MGGQGKEGVLRAGRHERESQKSLWEESIIRRVKLFKVEMSENLFTTYADLCK